MATTNQAGTSKRKPRAGQFVPGDPRICKDGAVMSKRKQIAKHWREWLEATDPTDAEGASRLDRLRDLLWEYATTGTKDGMTAIGMLLDRAYGKPTQMVGEDADARFGAAVVWGVVPPEANCAPPDDEPDKAGG